MMAVVSQFMARQNYHSSFLGDEVERRRSEVEGRKVEVEGWGVEVDGRGGGLARPFFESYCFSAGMFFSFDDISYRGSEFAAYH